MLKEYHRNLIYCIKDAYLGISGLEIAFQGVKQPFLLIIQRNVEFLIFHIVLNDDQV